MKKVAYKKETVAYSFPGLLQSPRQNAANNNSTPMLSTTLKHSALMSLAFFAFYLIQIFV